MGIVIKQPTDNIKDHNLTKRMISVAMLLEDSSLTIPIYQRPYKWTLKHINQLLSDIKLHQGKSSYRLGTIVFHEERLLKDNQLIIQKNIVDGQQRTISLILLIKAILKENKAYLTDENLIIQLGKIEKSLINPQFQSEISKTNIYQNYLEFIRLVKNADFNEDLINFVLNKCTFVTFTLTNISEAFQFFDAQNARGRDLEPHDLLKAYHLREFARTDEALKAMTVAHWENCNSENLNVLFAQTLYKIRNWANGKSARYFGKNDVGLFKGIHADQLGNYPYTEQLNILHHFINNYNQQHDHIRDQPAKVFPFQIDQTIINGRRFFEMITYYQRKVNELKDTLKQADLTDNAKNILDKIDSYEGRFRTGDNYVRSLFDSLLLYYLDRFGTYQLAQAIEKIFIWSYSLRLTMYAVYIETVDNYVLSHNLFRLIKEAIHPDDFLNHPAPLLKRETIKATKADPIKELFVELNYCE